MAYNPQNKIRWVLACLLALIFVTEGMSQIKVLVYRGFFGYEHSALRTATAVIQNQLPTLLEPTPAFTVDTAISPNAMTGANLSQYDVVVLNNNTGIGGLTTAQRSALYNFGQTKGIVGLHSTADFKGGASWPEMVEYIGGSLSGHTAAMGTLNMEPGQANHPINAGLGNQYAMNDEWYGYASNPRDIPGTTILWTIDETSMNWTGGGDMPGNDHAIAWCRELPGGGRMFYTAQAHRDSIMERNFHARRLVYNAILWVANAEPVGISVLPGESSADYSTELDQSTLRVSFAQSGHHSFRISQMDGRKVGEYRGEGPRTYSVSDLSPGAVYFISGETSKNSFSKKVVIP